MARVEVRAMPADADVLITSGKSQAAGRAPWQSEPQSLPLPAAQYGHDWLSRLPGLLGAFDWVGVASVGYLVNIFVAAPGVGTAIHPLGILLAATLTVNYLYLSQAYCVRSVGHATGQVARALLAWMATIMSLAGINYLVGDTKEVFNDSARLWYAGVFLYLLGIRCAVHWQLSQWRSRGRLARRVAVLGSGPAAAAIAHRLRTAKEAVLVGLFLDSEAPSGIDEVAGDADALLSLAVAGKVDEVIVALPLGSQNSLNDLVGRFSALQTEIKIDPGLSALKVVPRDFGFVAGVPTLTLQRRPLSGWGAPAKRIEDILFGSLFLMMLAPIMLVIAILIRIETRGPIIFRQERYGFNNNRIVVYKFRSMHHRSERDPSVPQARRNDPRVTRVGAFLRRTSLDELPQLFNVLRGDMSLVGPRPHASAHNEKYARLIDGYLARHRMKPGITGWAQVNGARGETESPLQMKRRLDYDLLYIANWSLLFDFKVLAMTIPAVFRGTNAY